MSQRGYHRYKVDNLTVGSHEISFYKNGNLLVTHSIIVTEFCTNAKLIKFLDKSGQYRFSSFNRFWESADRAKQLGRSNVLITSILDSQTNKKNIGYKNERTLQLTKEGVNQDQLDILSDIWTSPRIYLYVGDGTTDIAQDWIEVTISGKGTRRWAKGDVGTISLTVLLPENFTINML